MLGKNNVWNTKKALGKQIYKPVRIKAYGIDEQVLRGNIWILYVIEPVVSIVNFIHSCELNFHQFHDLLS